MSPGIDQITVKLIQAQGAVLCSEIYIYIYIYTHTPGYYKRNRHFQCCIETKLLMI